MSEHREAIRTAQELTDAMGRLSGEVGRLNTYGRRNRLLIAALAVALAIAVAALAVGLVSARQSASASAVASANHASSLAACQAGNVTRSEQIQLWNHVGAVSRPPPGATPAQARKDYATIRAFLAYVRKVFRPRPCESLYRIP